MTKEEILEVPKSWRNSLNNPRSRAMARRSSVARRSPGATDRVAGTTASTRELDAQFKASCKEAKKAGKAADKAEAETKKSN